MKSSLRIRQLMALVIYVATALATFREGALAFRRGDDKEVQGLRGFGPLGLIFLSALVLRPGP
jgi:hypothetical protein